MIGLRGWADKLTDASKYAEGLMSFISMDTIAGILFSVIKNVIQNIPGVNSLNLDSILDWVNGFMSTASSAFDPSMWADAIWNFFNTVTGWFGANAEDIGLGYTCFGLAFLIVNIFFSGAGILSAGLSSTAGAIGILGIFFDFIGAIFLIISIAIALSDSEYATQGGVIMSVFGFAISLMGFGLVCIGFQALIIPALIGLIISAVGIGISLAVYFSEPAGSWKKAIIDNDVLVKLFTSFGNDDISLGIEALGG